MSKRLLLPLGVAALATLVTAPAIAATRIGVVVVSHEGFTDDQSDEIAYDLAGAIATQIEGEAIAGASVREKLADPPEPGCEGKPSCGRVLAAKLATDEVLLLVIKKGAGKKDVQVTAHRVPRDLERAPTQRELLLTGNKAKRGKAVIDTVSALYPTGSATAYVEPPPPPPPSEEPPETEKPKKPQIDLKPVDTTPVYKKGWFWGALAGGVVVVAAAGNVARLARTPVNAAATAVRIAGTLLRISSAVTVCTSSLISPDALITATVTSPTVFAMAARRSRTTGSASLSRRMLAASPTPFRSGPPIAASSSNISFLSC